MEQTAIDLEQMNIVIVGHVDHGKSTVIGRLLADTGSLPNGKLEQVKAYCEANSRPFEYAFLLDALKDEQSQGITIDSARCFFKTQKRHYIIIDAPGHIEFLKNMISGAARAEAALLVIDAHEGIQENSKRHGHMLSMLGIRQVVVLVNKMDKIGYPEKTFQNIRRDYTQFLSELGVEPITYIPISALEGDNIASLSNNMPWYRGNTVLDQIDAFEKKDDKLKLPFRMPVQDIYKFTQAGDDRRIVTGTIDMGSIRVGEPVIFLPSRKSAEIKTIESFNTPVKKEAGAGEAVGFTLTSQIYIRPGEIMVRRDDTTPKVSSRIRANIFWMSKTPMIVGKTYKIKIAARRSPVVLVSIPNLMDASNLSTQQNIRQINRHDVAEVILETPKPLAFDLSSEIENTGRFVIVDNYEIAGGGIILESLPDDESTLKEHIRNREISWAHSDITPAQRAALYQHKPKFLLITGQAPEKLQNLAKALEQSLFKQKYNTYYLSMSNMLEGMASDTVIQDNEREEQIRRMGELARILTDSGLIFITALPDLDRFDIKILQLLNEPNEILVVNYGENRFEEYQPDISLEESTDIETGVRHIHQLLKDKEIFLEYYL